MTDHSPNCPFADRRVQPSASAAGPLPALIVVIDNRIRKAIDAGKFLHRRFRKFPPGVSRPVAAAVRQKGGHGPGLFQPLKNPVRQPVLPCFSLLNDDNFFPHLREDTLHRQKRITQVEKNETEDRDIKISNRLVDAVHAAVNDLVFGIVLAVGIPSRSSEPFRGVTFV